MKQKKKRKKKKKKKKEKTKKNEKKRKNSHDKRRVGRKVENTRTKATTESAARRIEPQARGETEVVKVVGEKDRKIVLFAY